jgi:hypothetical protein
MTKLLELSKKYGFKVTDSVLLVDATISTEDMTWLIDNGYHLKFEVSPLSFIWCERYLKGKQKEKEA